MSAIFCNIPSALFKCRQSAQSFCRAVGGIPNERYSCHTRIRAILGRQRSDIDRLQNLLIGSRRLITSIASVGHVRMRRLDGQHNDLLSRADFLIRDDEIRDERTEVIAVNLYCF